MNRRGFLAGIIAAAVAPTFVRPGIIMPIKPALVLPRGIQITYSGGISPDAIKAVWFDVTGFNQYGDRVTERLSGSTVWAGSYALGMRSVDGVALASMSHPITADVSIGHESFSLSANAANIQMWLPPKPLNLA